MPRPASPLAPGPIPSPPTEPHLVPMAGEWALWRDIAVRTAGFPVSGLDIFGARDEPADLRTVARDPLFQTTVTWQNRAAMRNAVAKIAAEAPTPGSAQRRREEVVASYWRARGLAALDRLERCRAAVAKATTPGTLDEALGT